MAPYLFWELIILIVGVWFMAALFVFYGWLLLKRQQKMIQTLLARTNPQHPTEPPAEELPKKPVELVISKNEPMLKYKDMEPDESVNVSLVDDNT